MSFFIDIRGLNHPNQSGIGLYTSELLKALFEIDQKNFYTLFSSGQYPINPSLLNPSSQKNITFFHLKIPNKLLNACLLFCKRPFFDTLLYSPSQTSSLFFFPNLNIISIHPTIPFVLTIHDLSFEFFPEFFSLKDRIWHTLCRPKWLAQKAKAIIVPSESTANDVSSFYKIPSEKIYIIPHGISSIFSNESTVQDELVRKRYHLPSRFVLFMGDIIQRKNIDLLLYAMKQYRQQTLDPLELVLVGKPGSASLKKVLPPFIHYLHYIPSQERPSFYRLALATLFPSIYEGFGMPIIESMACGTPVITSRTSSLGQIGSEATLLVDPYNANDLVVSLKQLLSSSLLQESLKQKGFAQIKKYTWQETAQKTLTLLQTILS